MYLTRRVAYFSSTGGNPVTTHIESLAAPSLSGASHWVDCGSGCSTSEVAAGDGGSCAAGIAAFAHRPLEESIF